MSCRSHNLVRIKISTSSDVQRFEGKTPILQCAANVVSSMLLLHLNRVFSVAFLIVAACDQQVALLC